MSNLAFVRKSIQIKANLSSQRLSYKPYPSTEFNNTFKFIAIESIAYFTNEEIDTVCTLSCNFVKSQAYNDRDQITSYEQPLKSFVINVAKKHQVRNFSLIWFVINSISEDLILSVQNFDKTIMKNNVDISVTIALC